MFPYPTPSTRYPAAPISDPGTPVNKAQLTAHLHVERYGDFWLTDAIRPSLDLQVVPQEGFCMGLYRDAKAGLRVPVLVASLSREKLFDGFLDLLDPLGDTVDVILETSHNADSEGHRDLHREHIELLVLKSHFCDFENLLLHDGCTGVAVISTTEPVEVQFDEHKLLIVYAPDLKPFAAILRTAGVARDDGMKFITEGEHLHRSDPQQAAVFEDLCNRLGAGEAAERVRG